MGGNYEVGYKRPPRNTRFQKGRSGNPKGRPKKKPTLWTELEAALGEKVSVVENERRVRIPKLELIVKQLTNNAAKGDARSIELLFRLQREHERTATSADGAPEREDDDAAFDALFEPYEPPRAPEPPDREK